nr:unnamed protein product [Callosobruchus chinensis]
MCSLCVRYKQGDDEIRGKLKERYEKHTLGKVKVRELKGESKVRSATGDLFANKSRKQFFYKSRLANFNLTF